MYSAGDEKSVMQCAVNSLVVFSVRRMYLHSKLSDNAVLSFILW